MGAIAVPCRGDFGGRDDLKNHRSGWTCPQSSAWERNSAKLCFANHEAELVFARFPSRVWGPANPWLNSVVVAGLFSSFCGANLYNSGNWTKRFNAVMQYNPHKRHILSHGDRPSDLGPRLGAPTSKGFSTRSSHLTSLVMATIIRVYVLGYAKSGGWNEDWRRLGRRP